MRVKIDHGEVEKGLIFKTKFYTVTVSIQFNEEELAIIRERELGPQSLLDRDPSAELKVYEADDLRKFYLRIQTLLNGPDTYCVRNIAMAKDYETELTEMLPKLKAFIMDNVEIEEKSKTLEF